MLSNIIRASARLVNTNRSQQVNLLARSFTTKQDLSGYNHRVLAVLGAQWGDEGKGKLVDVLAKKYDIICRFNGGANAGHTLVVNGKKFAFHLLPCGLLYNDKINIIGNGVVLDVPIMLKELQNLHNSNIDTANKLFISDRAHLLFEFHKVIDGLQEKSANIGTTKKGIGPCYSTKAARSGIRVGELLDWSHFVQRYEALASSMQKQYGFEYNTKEELARFEKYHEILKPMVIDNVSFLNESIRRGKKVLAEGANAALLDIDFGTYPYVTSSSTAAGGICTGLGIPPTKLDAAIGVVKAYTTRVGGGPFPTELVDAIGEKIRAIGHEFGTTTGRPRRCGWLDIPVLRYSHALNNYESLNITKLDVLSTLPEIKIGVAYKLRGKKLQYGHMPSTLSELAAVEVEYETHKGWMCDISKAETFDDLPHEARSYLKRVEELVEVPISWVGVGPGRTEMATRGFEPQY